MWRTPRQDKVYMVVCFVLLGLTVAIKYNVVFKLFTPEIHST